MTAWLAEIYAEPLFVSFAVMSIVVSTIAFVVFAAPMTILAWRKPEWAEPYRIQARKIGRRAIVWPSIRRYLLNNTVLAAATFASWPLLRLSGVHSGPIPAWYVIVGQLAFFLILDDFLFYWMHRSMHENRWLYKKIHSVHHRITTPWAVTGHFMHPVEYVATGTLMLVGPLLVGAHVVTIYIWIALRQWEAAEGHSGYDFPWSPSRLIPFSHGATHHDFHHAKIKGNYAGFFPWVDRMFGTICQGYPEHHAKRS